MFIEKLNKRPVGNYTIEEEKVMTNGMYEGKLDHDNVDRNSIMIYTLPNLQGSQVDNFILATPSEKPWETEIRVYSSTDKVYITYETTGDQVEADDINLLQEVLIGEIDRSTTEETRIGSKLDDEISRSTDKDNKLDTKVDSEITRSKAEEKRIDTKLDSEISRATSKENQIKTNLDNEIIRSTNKDNDIVANLNAEISRSTNKDNNLEQLKADKSYVDTELLKKYDKDKVYTKDEVAQLIDDLIGGSPDALDTLKEIADALNNDPDFASTMTTELSKKVDKVAGKMLSDENYSLTEKTKLAGIEEGAQVNAPIIDNLTSTSKTSTLSANQGKVLKGLTDDNKAKITGLDSKIDNELSKKVDKVAGKGLSTNDYTTAEKNEVAKIEDKVDKVSGKQLSTNDYTTADKNEVAKVKDKVDKVAGKGLSDENYSLAEKTKLAGVEAKANNYTHPSSHPASFIIESVTKRFSSDTEKATWNAKETPAGAQAKANVAESNAKDYTDSHINDTVKHITSTERTNWNNANSRKHDHSNKTVIDKITQALLDSWNSAVTHISDAIKHITSAERTKWNTVDNKSDKSYVDVELNKKLDKSGGIVSGDVRANNIAVGNEFTLGNNSSTVANERFKFSYNSSTGGLELWRFNFSNIWELSTVFPTRSGSGGLRVEGDVMASVSFVNNKVKTDVPTGAKFTDTIYTHPSSHPASIITQNSTNRFVTDAEKTNWNAKETPAGAQAKATTALNSAKSYAEGLNFVASEDTRAVDSPPSFYGGRRVTYEFKQSNVLGLSGLTYVMLETINPWSGYGSSHIPSQIAHMGKTIYTRQATSESAWGPWSKIFTQGTALTCNDLKGV